MGSRLVARNFTFTSPSGDKVGSRFQLELHPMPTIITHAAVPLCLGLGLGSRIIPPRLLLAGVAIAMLPDADVLAFKLGVAYGHVFGHRGVTHSLLFAFALPTLAMLFHRQFRASTATVWSFLLISLLSHSLLDSLTSGGKGVGWLWPWRDERFFAPWQVKRVAEGATRTCWVAYLSVYAKCSYIQRCNSEYLHAVNPVNICLEKPETHCQNCKPYYRAIDFKAASANFKTE